MTLCANAHDTHHLSLLRPCQNFSSVLFTFPFCVTSCDHRFFVSRHARKQENHSRIQTQLEEQTETRKEKEMKEMQRRRQSRAREKEKDKKKQVNGGRRGRSGRGEKGKRQ